MARMTMQMEGLSEFAAQLRAAASGGFKEQLRLVMNAIGMEFLKSVQNEIRAVKAVVTGNLINSFGKGGAGNIWDESDGGLTVDVGSNVEYATFVNDGHHTTSAGVEKRFVPGSWQGGRFVYGQGDGGMLLKRKWVPGHHFFEAAMRHSEPIFDRIAQKAVDEWIAKFF